MSQDTAELEKKLGYLEKQIKWMRIIFAVWLIGMAVNLSIIISRRTFSVRWLAIHDKQEKIRGWWDQDGFEMKDGAGVVRAKLGLFQDGSPYLQFYNQKHEVRAQLFLYSDSSGYLMLWDKDGKGFRYPPSKTPLP